MALVFSSCAKEPGEGGNSSIRGKVYGIYYNKSLTAQTGKGYVQDQDVYIIYGDEVSFGDRVRTSYDGAYEFKYLRKGKYKIYTYSRDTTMNTAAYPSGDREVIAEVEITRNKQVAEVPDLVIIK